MTKFKDDEFLGKTVKNTRIYCSIGVDKIKSIEQLRVAGGGSKFSSLCGFMFDSANEGTEFPRFMISFVCKLRSRIYRQQKTNPSKWFIFRKISNKRVDVLDKKAALVNYGFDVDKFFDSDMFKKCLPKFEAVLKKGLDDAKAFAESQENNTVKSEAERYIHSITESIPLMLKSTELNDKYYQLNNLDALEKAASDGISDEIKRKALDAKLAAISKGNKAFMDKVAANQRDVEYKRSEESEDVDEAKNPDDYKCKVQKKKEGGKEVWEVCELDGHWVATFHDEVAAKAFADEYPKLKAEYLDKAAEFNIEADKDDELNKEDDEAKLKEKELDANIEESLKEIYK